MRRKDGQPANIIKAYNGTKAWNFRLHCGIYTSLFLQGKIVALQYAV